MESSLLHGPNAPNALDGMQVEMHMFIILLGLTQSLAHSG